MLLFFLWLMLGAQLVHLASILNDLLNDFGFFIVASDSNLLPESEALACLVLLNYIACYHGIHIGLHVLDFLGQLHEFLRLLDGHVSDLLFFFIDSLLENVHLFVLMEFVVELVGSIC